MAPRYAVTHPLLRIDDALRADIEAAAVRLHAKLASLDPATLEISDYNRQCLAIARRKMTGSLQLSAEALQFTLAAVALPLSDIGFIDYGGGWGGLSLLARELGIGVVIFNDIYDVSCRDARIIARRLGLEAQHYCCGDIGDVGKYLRENGLAPQIIASQSVIEHIYDIEGFFRRLPALSPALRSIFMSTHANPYNPVLRFIIERDQRRVERWDRRPTAGHKERDSLRAYRGTREAIIKRALADAGRTLPAGDITLLADRTRGRMEPDIISATQRFLSAGVLPAADPFRYNTCDPLTGNWCEHFMDPPRLAGILAAAGFTTQVIDCLYVHDPNIARRMVQAILNAAIRVAGRKGIYLAYQYAIFGTRNEDRQQGAASATAR